MYCFFSNGTAAEQSVSIKLKKSRWETGLGIKDVGWMKSLRMKNSISGYSHEEIEGAEVGTTFANKGAESRIELAHKPLGAWNGVLGTQYYTFNFSAIGEERFLPETENENIAFFIYEEATYGPWKPSFGVRLDTYSTKAHETFSDADPDNPGEAVSGGPSFSKYQAGVSLSAGAAYALDRHNSIALNNSYIERAPNYQELFANGPHPATGAFERGDKNLEKEKSYSAELSYLHKNETAAAKFSVFVQNFDGYVALSPKGGGGFDPEGAPGNRDLTLLQYESMTATFYGGEMEIKKSFMGLFPKGSADIGLKVDTVSAKNSTTGANLPRITPTRVTVTLEYISEAFMADVELQRVETQANLAPNEAATKGYELVNLGCALPFAVDSSLVELYGRVNNLFNKEARNHVSSLKEIAPLPGLNLVVGIRGSF